MNRGLKISGGLFILSVLVIVFGVISIFSYRKSIEELVYIAEEDYILTTKSGSIVYNLKDKKFTCDKCNNIKVEGNIPKGQGAIIVQDGKVTFINITNKKINLSLDKNKNIIIKKAT